MIKFLEAFTRLSKKKNSLLCVGLDPALPNQRSENVIPNKYMKGCDENTARLNFCLDIIDSIADYAIAVKLNEQYMFGITREQHQKIADCLKKRELLSIYDCKLGDIGDSVESKISWIHKSGYDSLTAYAQPGNLGKVVKMAHQYSPHIGIIAITLMSNIEGRKFFIESKLDSNPLYFEIAREVKDCNADGCVVGATKHVLAENIEMIRNIVGNEKILLFPGIGAQEGDAEKAIRFGGSNIMINVGRTIIYSDNPSEIAKEYARRFNDFKKRTFVKNDFK